MDRLIEEGVRVRVLDNFSTGDKHNLTQHQNQNLLQLIDGDVRNFDLVQKAVGYCANNRDPNELWQ